MLLLSFLFGWRSRWSLCPDLFCFPIRCRLTELISFSYVLLVVLFVADDALVYAVGIRIKVEILLQKPTRRFGIDCFD